MDIKTDDSSNVKSLNKALSLIEELSYNPEGLPLTTIAKNTKINKSTAYRMLSTLENRGYIKQDVNTNFYLLSNQLLLLAKRANLSDSIIDIVDPILKQFQGKFNETLNLAELDGDKVTFIHKLDPIDGFFYTKLKAGDQMPLHCTAIGKVLLAYQAKENWEEYLDKNLDKMVKRTPNTITDKETFIQELELTKKRGFGLDNEENGIGYSCISAPIFNNNNQAHYGISLACISSNLNSFGINNMAELLIEVANDITKHINS